WKKYGCAPVERRPGVLVIAVDDPQDLTRLDGIRAMNLSPRYDFWVGMKHEILAYVAASYGERLDAGGGSSSASGEDLAKLIDGDCQKFMEVPGIHRSAVVQRLKIMAKLDISEKRKPQDGKIRFKYSKGVIELRVATIPTTNANEDVVMRILAASKPLPIEK